MTMEGDLNPNGGVPASFPEQQAMLQGSLSQARLVYLFQPKRKRQKYRIGVVYGAKIVGTGEHANKWKAARAAVNEAISSVAKARPDDPSAPPASEDPVRRQLVERMLRLLRNPPHASPLPVWAHTAHLAKPLERERGIDLVVYIDGGFANLRIERCEQELRKFKALHANAGIEAVHVPPHLHDVHALRLVESALERVYLAKRGGFARPVR